MYGKLKVETAEAVIEVLNPVRERFHQLMDDPVYLQEVLKNGAVEARRRAERVMQRMQEALGLPLDPSRFGGS